MSLNDKILAGFGYAILVLLIIYRFTYFDTAEHLAGPVIGMSLIIWALGGKILPERIKKADRILRGLIIILAFITGAYFYDQYDLLSWERQGLNNSLDFIFAGIVFLIVLVGAWRTCGASITIVVLVSILYGLFGPYLPGILFHGGISFKRILQVEVLEFGGIFGTFTQLGLKLLFIFIIFAGLIEGFGSMEYLIGIVKRTVGKIKYGLPQIAILSSLLFGMFSGSAAANVAGTGAVTIPMMKRYGLSPSNAGAIEAVASSGGAIMPPIMGLVAFIMADWLGIKYVKICAMGLAPALLYYISVAVGTFTITREDLRGYDKDSFLLQKDEKSFNYFEGVPILSAIGVLVIFFVLGQEILYSGLVMVLCFLVTRFIYDLSVGRKNPRSSIVKFAWNMTNGMKRSAHSTAWLTLLLAALNMVVEILSQTALPQQISFQMVDLSEGNLYVLLVLIGFVCILFGIAVATSAAYIFVVILAAPAVAEFGIPQYITHFVVFYLSILSAITPPVASACAVASIISGAPFLKLSWRACRLGIPLFILPFTFISNQKLLAGTVDAVIPFFLCLVPMIFLAYGFNCSLNSIAKRVKSFVYVALGVMALFYPVTSIRIAVLCGLFAFAILGIFYRPKSSLKTLPKVIYVKAIKK